MTLLYGQVEDQDSFHAVISSELKDIGIKVPKVAKSASGNPHASSGVFGGCIAQLPHVSVPQNGFLLQVPRFLLMATSVIRQNPKAEGLFRKGGSVQRQKELRRSLENGGDLENANVHDVANLVKQFLRCLSEPLLQPRLYDSFIKAYDLGDAAARRKAIFLLCALLPIEHLHVLRFLMAFFAEIASYTAYNKMDSKSLAIVLMPNLFMLTEELEKKDKSKEKLLQKQTGLVQFLIDNYDEIGSVCDHVLDRARSASNLPGHSDDDLDGNRETRAKLTAKKKRNSMNVFNGLRKMVQHNRVPYACNDEVDVSDGSLVERTPSHATKRKLVGDKVAAQCSSAKKRSVMQLRSEKLRPIPMTHLDSPVPVQNEDEVASSPAHLLGRNNDADLRKHKSSRMKFFGKTYMARRNSTSRSPKQVKKLEKESFSSSKKQIIGRHLNGGAHLEESPIHLSVPQPQPSPRSYRSILYSKGKDRETSPVCQIATRVGFNNCMALRRSPVSLSKASVADAPPGFGNILPSGTTKWHPTSTDAGCRVLRLDSAHRTRSFVTDPAAPMPSDQFASPVRSVIWRPLTKSSLRRGRPNTVRTGLPTPLPFKVAGASDVNPGMVHYTSDPGPMIDNGRAAFAGVVMDSPRPAADTSRSTVAKMAAVTGVQKVLVFNKTNRGDLDDDVDSRIPRIQKKKIAVRSASGCRESEETKTRSHRLPKSDSGIFEPGGVPAEDKATAVEVSEVVDQPSPIRMNAVSKRKSVHKSPSLDSGICHGECFNSGDNTDEIAPITLVVSPGCLQSVSAHKPAEARDAASTALPLSVDKQAGFCEPLPPNSLVLSTLRKAAANPEWRSAVDVFRGRANAGGAEEAAAGRPSLLLLMKDKAGSVTAAARRYDEIATKSRNPERHISLKSASPLLRARALHHQRSVSRDGTVAPLSRPRLPSGGRAAEFRKSATSARESKENLPRGNGAKSGHDKEGGTAKAAAARRSAAGTLTAKVVLTPSSSQNVPRRSTASVGRSKSDGRDEVMRRSPRIQARAKLNVARSRRSSNHQRRSTSM